MKPPRFVLYWPRLRSFRGWVIIAQTLLVVFINAVSVITFILWSVVWLLWLLIRGIVFMLVVVPYRLITGKRESIRIKKVDAAQARMQDYQDDKE